MRLYTAINLLLEANLLNEHILNVGKFQDRYRKCSASAQTSTDSYQSLL